MSRTDTVLEPMSELSLVNIEPPILPTDTSQRLVSHPYTSFFEAGRGAIIIDYLQWHRMRPQRHHEEIPYPVSDRAVVASNLHEYFREVFGDRLVAMKQHPVSNFTREDGTGHSNNPISGQPSKIDVHEFGLEQKVWNVSTGLVTVTGMF